MATPAKRKSDEVESYLDSYVLKTRHKHYYRTVAASSAEAQIAVLAIAAPSGYVISNCSTSAAEGSLTKVWDTDVTYEVPSGTTAEAFTVAPTLRPSVLSISFENWTDNLFEDTNNKKYLNSAGDPFDSNYPITRHWMIINVQRNVSSFNALAVASMVDTYNSGAVNVKGGTFAMGTLLFLPPQITEQWEQWNGSTAHYFSVTWSVKYNAKGWDKIQVPDMGYREMVNGQLRPIMDQTTNEPITKPCPLLDGQKSWGTPHNIEFKPYAGNTWSGIDFS